MLGDLRRGVYEICAYLEVFKPTQEATKKNRQPTKILIPTNSYLSLEILPQFSYIGNIRLPHPLPRKAGQMETIFHPRASLGHQYPDGTCVILVKMIRSH